MRAICQDFNELSVPCESLATATIFLSNPVDTANSSVTEYCRTTFTKVSLFRLGIINVLIPYFKPSSGWGLLWSGLYIWYVDVWALYSLHSNKSRLIYRQTGWFNTWMRDQTWLPTDRGLLYQHVLILFTAWILINNRMLSKMCELITFPLRNFNGCTAKVWECISNSTPHFIMDVTTSQCWN